MIIMCKALLNTYIHIFWVFENFKMVHTQLLSMYTVLTTMAIDGSSCNLIIFSNYAFLRNLLSFEEFRATYHLNYLNKIIMHTT